LSFNEFLADYSRDENQQSGIRLVQQRYDMSEEAAVKSPTVEALEARVVELESKVASVTDHAEQLELSNGDTFETLRSFGDRINEYGGRSEKAIAEIHERLVKKFADDLASFGARLHASFAKDVVVEAVAKVSSETIAESLTKKVLVTRPATRAEAQSGDTLVVRNAQPHELK
jgi:hypothetical protein